MQNTLTAWEQYHPDFSFLNSFPPSAAYMGQYQIVVHFGYGSTVKYFVNICVFSLI